MSKTIKLTVQDFFDRRAQAQALATKRDPLTVACMDFQERTKNLAKEHAKKYS